MALSYEQVIEAYQSVFSATDGQIVLSDILSQLGFFSNIPERIKPECIAVANTILSRCGIMNSASNGIYMEGLAYAINTAIAMNAGRREEDDEI